MDVREQKRIASAIKLLEKKKLDKSFDPFYPDSVPTDEQLEILKDIGNIQYRFVVAGNQCKPAYSLVKMADGSLKYISEIKVGDMVMAYDKATDTQIPTPVIKTWKNGIKPVNRYWVSGRYTDSTANHQMPRYTGGKIAKARIDKCDNLLQEVWEMEGIDTLDSKMVELLGYLLGDGCFRITRPNGSWKGLQFTGTNPEIINHVKSLLDSEYYLREVGNGDFFISKIQPNKKNSYIDFIRQLGLDNLLAHEKFIPEEIFHQSKDTRRKFLAGLIATDGCVGNRRIQFYTTSTRLANDVLRLMAGLGLYAIYNIRKGRQLQHKDEHCIQISRAEYYNKFLAEIKVPGKHRDIQPYKGKSFKSWGSTQIDRVEYLGEMEVYDITILHHDHIYICDGFYTGNSGKSMLAAREVAWFLNNTHPYYKRPESWGDEPLLVIIAGQDLTNMATELWAKKLKPFLNASEWKEERQGNSLKKVTHRQTGDTIIFLSHGDGSENARKHMQSYVAHYVWLDEMPSSHKILEELQRRVDSRQGRFLATFTPKFKNDIIRRVVDASKPPVSKKYSMSKLKNPIYKTRIKEEIQKLAGYSEAERNTILYGSWSTGEDSVYHFDYAYMVAEEIPGYSKGWRHVESVDPAMKSKFGYTLWAEDPATGIWYLVDDRYITGMLSPDDLVMDVKKRSSGYNIVLRVCDPHEGWYLGQAQKFGLTYQTPYDKNNRKHELIKGLQLKLSEGRIKIAPWCSTFIDEIQSCQWAESGERIVNASIYHTLDCSQYFCDLMPKPDVSKIAKPWETELRQANTARKLEEVKQQNTISHGGRVKPIRAWGRR